MEFRIQKKDLSTALERTLTVVEKRNTMPSLNHALFEVKDSELQVSATDLEIFVSSKTSCRTLSDGRMALPARNLAEIIRYCDDSDSLHFKSGDNQTCELRFSESRVKLLGLSADSFPHFKTSPKGQLAQAKLKSQDFLNLLSKVEHCICTEEIRYFLTGVYFEKVIESGQSSLRTVATDAHRLALLDIPETKIGKLDLKKGLIIPRKGVSELKKLLEKSSGEFDFTCDENLIRATVGDHSLWIRPIDGEYPDYRRVLPTRLPELVKIQKKDLMRSLKIMLALVSERSKVVTFDFIPGSLTLSTNNPDRGEAQDRIPIEYQGPEMKTGFNVHFFIEALTQLDGEEIELEIGEKLQPVLLKSQKNSGYVIVIMPMRV